MSLTTALVRHNVAPPVWPSGIAAFTVAFTFGQIVGPGVVDWIADSPGGMTVPRQCATFTSTDASARADARALGGGASVIRTSISCNPQA